MEFLSLPMMLVLIGAIASAVGGFLATFRQGEEQRKSAQEQLKYANERVEFEKDLRAKSEEIAELNRTIAASVIGGDSFCYVTLASANQKGAFVTVVHQGKYPLYDVRIRMVELDAFEKNFEKSPNSTFDDVEKALISLDVGNMSPGVSNIMRGISFSNPNKIGYNISIFARNGSFTDNP